MTEESKVYPPIFPKYLKNNTSPSRAEILSFVIPILLLYPYNQKILYHLNSKCLYFRFSQLNIHIINL